MSEVAPRIINSGRTYSLFDGVLSDTGTHKIHFAVHADTLLLSLFVRSLATGTVTVTASTLHYPNEELPVISFPVLSAPTTELVLKKAAVVLSNCTLTIEYTGTCDLQVVAKGLSVGDLSVSVVGASELQTRKSLIGTSPTILIPAALEDRAGLLVKNWSNATVYLAESSAQLVADQGYPITPGESLAIDVAAGQVIWAQSTKPNTDIRIVEAAT